MSDVDLLPASTNFVTIERKSVVALAIEQIRRMITVGTLEPGQRLPPERELSELLGVSRPSVREAIRALSFMGVLEIRQGSGTYISSATSGSVGDALGSLVSVSRGALSDLVDVRTWLESGAAERAATRISDADIARLEEILAELKASVDDVHAFLRADIAFHRIIHEACDNPILLSLMLAVSALEERSRLITGQHLSVRRSTIKQHARIVRALRQRDPLAARKAMRDHLAHVAAFLPAEPSSDLRS